MACWPTFTTSTLRRCWALTLVARLWTSPRITRCGWVDGYTRCSLQPTPIQPQLLHHLLGDVLTNLEEHYRVNFVRWVRKYCRSVLEVDDEEVPLAGLAGTWMVQLPPGGDEEDAEDADDGGQVGWAWDWSSVCHILFYSRL
jgi:hypothetical protein